MLMLAGSSGTFGGRPVSCWVSVSSATASSLARPLPLLSLSIRRLQTQQSLITIESRNIVSEDGEDTIVPRWPNSADAAFSHRKERYAKFWKHVLFFSLFFALKYVFFCCCFLLLLLFCCCFLRQRRKRGISEALYKK